VVENVYDVDGVMVGTSVNGVATDLLVDTSGSKARPGLSRRIQLPANLATAVFFAAAVTSG